MPRKLINDYVFYKFVCNDENIECCYVGSTANFSDRKRHHYDRCNNPNDKKTNYKIYEIIRANGGWENWKMVIIGEEKEISLTQSRILEQKYIDELKANMNMCKAYRTKEDILENGRKQSRKHYEKYKEQVLEDKKKIWINMNEEKKQQILENMKIISYNHYQANKEKINERRRLLRLEKKNEKIV
jgi:hypothetical protein